ncbi:acid phosphatase 1 [Selaginella moellendorffii]|nr:acid phosphatase 1 [Selaginella moellendorffii]|eukprot:XP_002974832.2 acid phosphatase 1 [Selaginella moellendorffii]
MIKSKNPLCFLSLFMILASTFSHCFDLPPRLPGESVHDYCQSFHLNAEAGNILDWTLPVECVAYVRRYTTGPRYLEDMSFVAYQATRFSQSISVRGHGRDSWVFEVDETLLSNAAYFAKHNYGASLFNQTDFNIWVAQGKATAIVSMRTLYWKLIDAHWTVYLMSQRRTESQRAVTEKNLRDAGYKGWKKLFLQRSSRSFVTAVEDIRNPGNSDVYKKIEKNGGIVHASVGSKRNMGTDSLPGSMSFKAPNAMY